MCPSRVLVFPWSNQDSDTDNLLGVKPQLHKTLCFPIYQSTLGEASEDIAQFIYWRRHESRNSLEGRFVWCSRVTACGDEQFGPPKAFRHGLGFTLRQGLLERGKIQGFLSIYMLAQFGPKRFERRFEVGFGRR
jgi:hypothetical protein